MAPTRIESPRDRDIRVIVDEHGPAMYRVAVGIVRDPALAEDVVQDALVNAWRHLDDFRGDGALRAWLLRITHNVAVSTLRRRRDDAWDPADLPDQAMHDHVEATAEARDDLERVAEALGRMDELSRTILSLREGEGMSYDEIASTLGVTLGQVKIRLLRARRALAAAAKETGAVS